jgi:hypothetical protein
MVKCLAMITVTCTLITPLLAQGFLCDLCLAVALRDRCVTLRVRLGFNCERGGVFVCGRGMPRPYG